MTAFADQPLDLTVALIQFLLMKEAAELHTQPMLYHYTSAAGLYGILSSGVLRASNYLYLNDTSEIEYGKTLVIEHLREQADTESADIRQLLLDAADRLERYTRENEPDPILRDAAPLDVYLTSFCEQPNLLSQWRAYGGAEGRYCIGFDVKALRGFDMVHPVRVVYDRSDQLALLSKTTETIVASTVYTLREKQLPPPLTEALPFMLPKWYAGEREILSDAEGALHLCLDRLLCRLKHPAFAEEREWRSIVDLSHYDPSQLLNFEVLGGKVRPYVERLRGSESDPKRLPIREIYVGYSRRPAQAKRTVELLLRHFGYRDCEVKVANVPVAE